MPTRSDVTVVAAAYSTSGNGGRKLVRLKSGNQYAALKDDANNYRIYKSTDNWATPGSYFVNINPSTATDIALATDGLRLYAIYTSGVSLVGVRGYDEAGAALSNLTLDVNLMAVGNVSLAINEAGTELHAAYTCKNSTYPNSFNIRYAKGAISASTGAVTWEVPENRTTFNTTGSFVESPTIVVTADGNPLIIAKHTDPPTNSIRWYKRAPNGTWLYSAVYGDSYAHASPSAIFVPQSINGLTNGRVWVSWHGTDATDTSQYNIRVAYSDDGGATWTVAKLTSGNYTQALPSITANKNNEVFIIFEGRIPTGPPNALEIREIKWTVSGGWGATTTLTSIGTSVERWPSALYDPSFDFMEPLFVYMGASKVGFYGAWTVNAISVTPGDIGFKSDKSNLLSYNITTDGSMSEILEMVNGVTIATKTAASGASLVVGLTQEQWDSVRYGKYKDNAGGRNTLSISMGADTWTYTFDKGLAAGDDLLSAVKAAQDAKEVFLPSVKAKLAAVIRSIGVPVLDIDAWDTFISAIGTIVPDHVMGPGENLLFVRNTTANNGIPSATMTKVHTLTMGETGVFRVRFKLQAYNYGNVAFGQIYKNGVAFGPPQQTDGTTTTITFTQDLSFKAGDTCELWCRATSSGAGGYAHPAIYGDVPAYAIEPNYPY